MFRVVCVKNDQDWFKFDFNSKLDALIYCKRCIVIGGLKNIYLVDFNTNEYEIIK